MNEELKKILKYLRLGGLLAHWDQWLAEAERGRFSHVRLLKHVLEAEYRLKSEQALCAIADSLGVRGAVLRLMYRFPRLQVRPPNFMDVVGMNPQQNFA